MKPLLAILLFATTAVACGDSHSSESPQTPAQASANGVVVETEQVPVSIAVEGTVFAPNRAEITTRMMARVTALNADVGNKVRRGQVLIQLGNEDIAANRSKAEAAVTAAEAGRDEAARHLERMETLLAQDVVPKVQRDQARLQLTQAESQVALAAASLREVETAGSYASIRAPFEGEVVARYIDVGDVAAPGMPLVVVEETGPREARLAVPIEAARSLSQGSPVRVNTLGGLSAEGPVRAVAAGADPISKTVEVRVGLPADWPTGASVTALIPAGTTEAVTIPVDAVVRRGQLTGVQVVTQEGVALRWIRLGRTLSGGERVEVLSGLNPGDQVVL
ncbi:efflux RND transporter periplasmic adaptor subunit [Gemmatimonadota bacterium]